MAAFCCIGPPLVEVVDGYAEYTTLGRKLGWTTLGRELGWTTLGRKLGWTTLGRELGWAAPAGGRR
eukprot:75442-Prymnesium_polylepis.3